MFRALFPRRAATVVEAGPTAPPAFRPPPDADRAAVLAALATHVRLIANADGAALVERRGDSVAYLGEDSIAPLFAGRSFPARTCISGLAILEERPVLIPDIFADPRVPLHLYLSTFVRRIAVLPFAGGDRAMAIAAYWREPGSIDVTAVSHVADAARVAGDALDRLAGISCDAAG